MNTQDRLLLSYFDYSQWQELLDYGLEPGPPHAQQLFRHLFASGRGYKREQLRELLRETWERFSGKPWGRTSTQVMHVTRRIIERMEQEGEVRRLAGSHGVYVPVTSQEQAEDDGCVKLGKGSAAVYAACDPSKMDAAVQNGEARWEIKVGHTTQSVQQRLRGAETWSPGGLTPLVVLRTDTPRELEQTIHAVLRLRGCHLSKEWFKTNPQELVEVYRAALGK